MFESSDFAIHSGEIKSGPWLLEATVAEYTWLDRLGAPRRKAPAASPADEWMANDWRKAPDGGAFNSTVRPPMSSDIPHPEKVLDPTNKNQAKVLAHTQATQDPENDPWNVLHGTGQSFEDLVNNHQGHLQNMSPDQDYEGRVWYRAAHEGTKDLADKTLGHHGRTVATMSAFSPKTLWDENLEKAHHFLTHYNGDPSFSMPGMQGPVESAKAIYHAPEGQWQKALTGPKRQAFAHNILDPSPMREPRPGAPDDAGFYQIPTNPHSGQPDWRMHPDQDSTIDTHHVRMSNTPHGSDLNHLRYDTPAYFGKKTTVNGQSYDPSYDLHARAAWEATRRHNATQSDPGRHLIPKQSQAGPWTKFKSDLDAAGRGAGRGGEWPEPGVKRKKFNPDKPNYGLGPLTDPIPRYQKDQDVNWWDDPRRPDVNLRETPNWHRRPTHFGSNTSSPWWDAVLAAYIERNPQHSEQDDQLIEHEQQRLGPHPHEARNWYL